jgi:hypothetical protein
MTVDQNEYEVASSSDGVVPAVYQSIVGSLGSATFGKQLHATMSPEQQIYVAFASSVSRLSPHVLLYSGQALDASKHTFISYDAGLTWSYLRASQISSGSVTATNSRYARYFEHFTTDTGRTWTEYPLPDSFQRGSSRRYFYVGDGRFAIRDPKTARWYEVDATTGVYTEANIPYEVRDVFLLPNGDLLGTNRNSAPTTTIWRRRRDAADMVPVTLAVPEGVRPDSVNVVRSEYLFNGMLAMLCESVPGGENWLLITDGDMSRVVMASLAADSARCCWWHGMPKATRQHWWPWICGHGRCAWCAPADARATRRG